MAPRPGTALTLGEPGYWPEAPAGSFDVYLQGVPEGQQVEVTFWETDGTDEEQRRADRKLGSVSGKTAPSAKHPGRMTIVPDGPPPEVAAAELSKPVPCVVAFRLQPPVGTTAAPVLFRYTLADAQADVDEGDCWELVAKVEALELVSPKHTVARVRRGLGTADATYRPHDGEELVLYNDASTDEHGSGGAFFDLLAAIEQAQSFIFIADWSFHPLFRPSRLKADAVATWETSIGAKLIAKAGQGLLVAIHAWDHTTPAVDSQNDNGQEVFVAMLGHARPKNLLWRVSSHDNTGMSHHQKFVVMDAPPPPGSKDGRRTVRVFFGGLDLTQGRFDFPSHPILPPSPENPSAWPFVQEWHTPNFVAEHTETVMRGDHDVIKTVPQVGYQTNEWYNAEFGGDTSLPRQPWHDIYGNAWGPAAWDFVREFVGRWGCDPTWNPTWGDNSKAQMEQVHEVFRGLFDSTKYKQQWESYDGPFTSQVLRSIIKSHWNDELEVENKDRNGRATGREKELGWHQEALDAKFEQSILRADRQAIGQAEKFIYIETQYFIGGGKSWGVDSIQNDLPVRIVERIKERRKAGVPFHAYVVIPMYPEGDPVSWPIQEQRWLEWRTMEWMIKQLGSTWKENLSFYFPANWTTVPPEKWNLKGGRKERVRAHQRYMIYVHSKLMLVDDRFAIFGSANLNERSLAGNRDTEIACAFRPTLGREAQAIETLRTFRQNLWEEHLGKDPSLRGAPEQRACWSRFQELGVANYTSLRSLSRESSNGALCYLPFTLSPLGVLTIKPLGAGSESGMLLPDSPEADVDKAKKLGWAWSSPGSATMRKAGVAE